MERYTDGWKSAALAEKTDIAVYGHYGPAILLFPFDGEDYLSSEHHGLIESMMPSLEAGLVKVFTIGSIDRQSWLNEEIAPRQKSLRHQRYNRYITQEVVPFIAQNMRSSHPVIYTSGISLGALHAVNSFLRRPDLFEGTIGISGNYDLKAYTNGYYDNDVYFNSPQDYLVNLTGPALNRLRQKQKVLLVSGQGEGENPDASRAMGELLGQKDIPNWVDIWGEEFGHNWDSWRAMMHAIVQRNF
jgi:esterase/lipase superfamily enzyme